MMPFGRNNRSQNKLAEPGSTPAGPAGAVSVSASSISPPSAPFSSSSELESFGSTNKNQEFIDAVGRSQSQRYPQVPPLQTQQQQYLTASSSADDLPNTVAVSPPLVQQGQPIALGAAPQQALQPQQLPQLQQQQPHQPALPKAKQSTRKLIKNILGGTNSNRGPDIQQQQQQQQQQLPPNSYDNTAGLARRPSQRVSHLPSIRTAGSQISLEQQQQQQDWPPPQGLLSQPSPLQGVEEFTDRYVVTDPTQQDPRLQGSQTLQSINTANTIRQVHQDAETSSPYSPDDIGYQQHQGHIQAQGRAPPVIQRHYSQPQVNYDPAHQQQQIVYTSPPPAQYQESPQAIFAGQLGNPQQQNPETVSQLSHESPVTDSDQQPPVNFQPTTTSPGVTYPPIQTQDIPRRPSQAQGSTPTQQSAPVQQLGPPPPNRRSQENDKTGMRGQGDLPPGPPPNYRHSQAQSMSPLPAPPVGAPGGPNPPYRAGSMPERPPQPQYDGSAPEGRNSPQPSASGDQAEQEKAYKDLLTKYKNVKRLYFEGKNQIEQLNTQIEHLQNAVANQRMSQSRTSLDDNEYTTRFNRLNGAINNLSFNIRKDWVTLPSWLDRFVSPEALKTGKQEMTAVGRAIISRWVFDEIFNRCFHPGLEADLSRQLKEIELNIRRFSYTMTSQEEFDALTSKVVGWRMATLEGLQRVLQGPESVGHKSNFTQRASSNLTAILYQHLAEPPPPGVEGSASMIVELAVGIAANLPLESRDVAIVYPLPMDPVQPELMDVEKTGLPMLDTRPSDASEGDGSSAAEEGGAAAGSGSSKDAAGAGDKAAAAGASGKESRRSDKTRSGMFTTVLGGAGSRKGSNASSNPGPSNTDAPPAAAHAPKDAAKVRLAGFMAVEVRGRQVLVKAPIWTMV